MKIIDIYNLPRKTSFDIEQIFRLKDWGRNIFSIHNNIGVNWASLKKNIPGLQGYFTETDHNKFYSVSLNDKQFILVNYDKVMQFFTPYCTDPETYESFMKLLIAHSDLSYCHFASNIEQNILLPNDNDYYDQYED